MSKRIQLRRGTATEHSTFVGADGEVTVDTTKKALVLHDGVTAGGVTLPYLEGGKIPSTQLPDSTVSTKGAVKIATVAEVNAGTDFTKFVTPTTLRTGVKTLLNVTDSAPMYACRAWANFDGTTSTIRGSGNVSSIGKNGTGDYTVNFITAMPDTNYTVCTGGTINAAGTTATLIVIHTKTTASFKVRVYNNSFAAADLTNLDVGVFR